jgi:hypothetical protein
MTDGVSPSARRPWYLLAAGVFGLLWGLYGLYDYVMSLSQGADYYQTYAPPDLVAYYVAMPGWQWAIWSLTTLAAITGGVALLARSRLSVPAYAVALVSGTTCNLVTWFNSNGAMAAHGPPVVPVVIFVVTLLLLAYAAAMARRNALH